MKTIASLKSMSSKSIVVGGWRWEFREGLAVGCLGVPERRYVCVVYVAS